MGEHGHLVSWNAGKKKVNLQIYELHFSCDKYVHEVISFTN